MKVGQSGSGPVQGSEVNSSRQSGRAASVDSKKTEKSGDSKKSTSSDVKAEISAKSRELATAKSIASHAPDVREDRVADLKKRISEGSYKINSDAIADRMVDEHFSMSDIG